MTAFRLRIAFVAAAMAWAVLLLVAPFIFSRPHASPLEETLVFAVYGVGHIVCHQLPERSYRVWGAQMPVCARCAGIYFGAAVAAVVASVARGLSRHGARASVASPRLARRALLLAVLPTAFTLVYEWTTGQMPAHVIRAAAGVPIGVVVAWLVVGAADYRVN